MGGSQTKPGEQPHRASGPVFCGVTAAPGVFVGIGQTKPSVTVVWPPIIVRVTPGRETVVVTVVTTPGSVEVTTVPACVKVVENPGRLVVTTEVIIVPGSVRVVTLPGSVRVVGIVVGKKDVRVGPSSVTVVKEPLSDVVMVVPGSVIVVGMRRSDVVTTVVGMMRSDVVTTVVGIWRKLERLCAVGRV